MLVVARNHLRSFCLVSIAVVAALAVGHLVIEETKNSHLQARVLSSEAGSLFFWLHDGSTPQRVAAPDGPFDRQRGYTRIPEWIEGLETQGFEKTWEAGVSSRAIAARDSGLYPLYRPAPQAGLTILGDDGTLLHDHKTPGQIYESFELLPDLMVETLLFIENRELLEPGFAYRNPAVEWKRFAHATVAFAGREAGISTDHFGGSTLATQLEKFRHSPRGITDDETEKFRQMLTAALRAYRFGPDTTEHRRSIVLDYINGVPLAASPGYGEVQGVADGLRVWFGADPKQVAASLERLQAPRLEAELPISRLEDAYIDDARAFRMVLSLFLAHRRPSHYLVESPTDLYELTDAYARIMAAEGIITPRLRDAVLVADSPVLALTPAAARPDFRQRKAVDAVRSSLLNALDISHLYQLDRHDLFVQSTINGRAQRGVDDRLIEMKSPEFLETHGLVGHRLLHEGAPLDEVTVSFTLFEKTPQGIALRILADNHDQPLNINEHIKLDLGSTAKLRTLVTYLELIADLHSALMDEPSEHLQEIANRAPDGLRAWTAAQLAESPQMELSELLEAAMDREYSANPNERFFTGGGMHQFSNFEHRRNHRQSVREAFRHSVNLVFIRMMRDIVDHFIWLDPERIDAVLGADDTDERHYLLSRFADREGKEFQYGFYERYADLAPEDIADAVVDGRTLSPTSVAMVATIFSDQDEEGLRQFVAAHSDQIPDDDQLQQWLGGYDRNALSWQDRGHLTGIHPLELWTAFWLHDHPDSTLDQTLIASRQVRQDVYQWLFRTRYRSRQDQRIRTLLEVEAFEQIQNMWRRHGYPFDQLVPSYATSIGSSADRPVALAELMGIIVNDGVRAPEYRVDAVIAGPKTPYETRLEKTNAAGERVFSATVAQTLRTALIDVAEHGTARRIDGKLLTQDGSPLVIGGKTGTGDHDHKIFEGRRLVDSRPVHRTATFAFFLDDRFFGTITAFVSGEPAGEFRFTSALPTMLLSTLYPAFSHMIDDTHRNLDPHRSGVTDPGGPLAVAAYNGTPGQIKYAALRQRGQLQAVDELTEPVFGWKELLDAELIGEIDPFRHSSREDMGPRLDWHHLLHPEFGDDPGEPDISSWELISPVFTQAF